MSSSIMLYHVILSFCHSVIMSWSILLSYHQVIMVLMSLFWTLLHATWTTIFMKNIVKWKHENTCMWLPFRIDECMSLHEGASLIQCKIFTLVSRKHFILKRSLLQASKTSKSKVTSIFCWRRGSRMSKIKQIVKCLKIPCRH